MNMQTLIKEKIEKPILKLNLPFTQIPKIIQKYRISHPKEFTKYEVQIMDLIKEYTFGFHREWGTFSQKWIAKKTDIHYIDVNKTLRKLADKNFIKKKVKFVSFYGKKKKCTLLAINITAFTENDNLLKKDVIKSPNLLENNITKSPNLLEVVTEKANLQDGIKIENVVNFNNVSDLKNVKKICPKVNKVNHLIYSGLINIYINKKNYITKEKDILSKNMEFDFKSEFDSQEVLGFINKKFFGDVSRQYWKKESFLFYVSKTSIELVKDKFLEVYYEHANKPFYRPLGILISRLKKTFVA